MVATEVSGPLGTDADWCSASRVRRRPSRGLQIEHLGRSQLDQAGLQQGELSMSAAALGSKPTSPLLEISWGTSGLVMRMSGSNPGSSTILRKEF